MAGTRRTGTARKAGHTSDHGPLAGAVHLPGATLPGRVQAVQEVHLATPLTRVVEEKYAQKLAKVRGIETVEDLLWFVPTRFTEAQTRLDGLRPGQYLVTVGTITRAEVKVMRNGRPGQKMLTATVSTDQGPIAIVFFVHHGHAERLVPGVSAVFQGTASQFNGTWQISHPLYDILPAAASSTALELRRRIIPLYREVKGMPPWSVGHCAQLCVEALVEDEPLPDDLRARHGLPTFVEAMRMQHLPEARIEVAEARRRFAYDEALAMQIVLARRRRDVQTAVAVPRAPRADGLAARFDERLPFTLTEAQREAGREIAEDLSRERPMNRLLQGEVGSGKTLVALRAMLSVVDAGGQAALLAPTEVLAAQHHRSITTALGDLAEGGLLGGATDGTRVTLLTGSMPTSTRRAAMLQIASGEAGIVVGTHSLLQDKVTFASLGLVVVDEQHRFGVEQRDALSAKAEGQPHLLVMTATPIPRTVAMTVFGDMEVTTMRGLPPGRSPISTHVVDNPRWYDRSWARVAEEVSAGHQAYVVCPRIDASDDDVAGLDLVPAEPEGGEEEFLYDDEEALFGGGVEVADARRRPRAADAPPMPISDLSAVDDVAAELRARPDFADIRVGVLHGRLPTEEKDAVMAAFGAGEIDVLVSTTVIEVGVDVPNATVMVVMNADRFGVSQLHQLRGRVGRGSAPGLCLLVTRAEAETSRRRVQAVADLTDGFALADVDLAERREGDILGARQSGGRSRLRVLRLARDEAVIETARHDAARIVEADPDLSAHPALRSAVLRAVDDDAAEFLTRG